MTDITGTRLARSGYDAFGEEAYAGIDAQTHPADMSQGSPWPAVPAKSPVPSEPQYVSMSSSGGASVPAYATQWWGYPTPPSGLNPMANPWWGYQSYPDQGQHVPQHAKPHAKAKAKAKGQAKAGTGPAAALGPAVVTAPKTAQTPQATEVHQIPDDTATTVMLRNIPNRYTQSMLLELLDNNGFLGKYDFVYLPMDFRNAVNLGYAFVNLLDHTYALDLMRTFHGYAAWLYESTKVCEVSWAHPHQGLSQHVERYRNSPVMHPSMPDEYKPMVFQDGQRLPFPLPTKTIRAPKLRPVRDRAGGDGAREGRGED